MGRSVATHTNAERIIFFTVDEDSIEAEDFEELKDTLLCWTGNRWPSIEAVRRGEWHGREVQLIAQNGLAQFWLSEYGGMYALSITARTDSWNVNMRNVGKPWIWGMLPVGFPFKRYHLTGRMSNGVGVFNEVPA